MEARSRPPVRPGLVLALGVIAVSTGAIFVRKAEAPALVVAFWRTAVATLVFLPLALRPLARELPRLGLRSLVLAVVSGAFLALHFATWIASLDHTSVAASLVLVNTTPLWVGLLTPLLTQDRMSASLAAGILISVTGSAVIGIGDLHLRGEAFLGDLLALGGALAMACYVIAGRRLRPRLSLLSYAVVCYGSASLVLLILVLAAGQRIVGYSMETHVWMLALALVPQVIGHTSYNWTLRWLSAAVVSLTLLGEPVLATVLAWLLLAEAPPGSALAGGLLVLIGIALAARGEARAARR